MHQRVDDLPVASHFLRLSVGDLVAVVEHDDAIGQIHDDADIVLNQRDRRAEFGVHVENEAAHVLLFFEIHAGHRLVEKQKVRLHGERPSQLDALLQAVGQTADRLSADALDLEKVDDLLAIFAMLDFLRQRRSIAPKLPEEAFVHAQRAAGQNIVERRHAFEQRNILEGASDALCSRLMRAHPAARRAFIGDAALLRMIKAVDDVEHRRLAGAVRADDGAYLAAPDFEGDVADGAHPAEGERDVLNIKKRFARLLHGRGCRNAHAARSRGISRKGAVSVSTSSMRTRAASTPLRPSS